MAGRTHAWRQQRRAGFALLPIVALAVALAASGCQHQKQTDTGKTYTSDQKGGSQGGSQSGGGGSQAGSGGSDKSASGGGNNAGGQSSAQPLGSPADTTDGKASKASDAGSSDATRGQVVAEPGAPVEREPAARSPKASPPNGH